MNKRYTINEKEYNEFEYCRSFSPFRLKTHYLQLCFTIPFFLLLTIQMFDHLQTPIGKFVAAVLSIAWLGKGVEIYWDMEVARHSVVNEYDKKEETSLMVKKDQLIVDEIEISRIKDVLCLQNSMALVLEEGSVLIPWRIFENEEEKNRIIRLCMEKRS